MKDIIEHVSTENCTYPIVFNLNVMESLQKSMKVSKNGAKSLAEKSNETENKRSYNFELKND